MISFDEAFAIVQEQAKPLGKELVALAAARGRRLAEPVRALVDHPPADVSAMDGYAVRESDLASGRTEFSIVGESFPGAAFPGSAEPGTCVRIFTGAELPAGFDRIVIQENVRREGNVARLVEAPSPSTHVRRKGSDFRVGDLLLDPGRLLDSRALVAAAGADVAELMVFRRPRIAVLSTGDELVPAGQARSHPGSIPESLSPGLAALAEEWGGEMVAQYRLRDDPELIEASAAEALEKADVVVVTGGASVGEKDFAKAAFEGFGLELLFSKIAIKPGKPVWFGRAHDRLIVGLPGNPTSAMVTARLLLVPLLCGMTGGDPAEAVRWRSASLADGLEACGSRETFVRGTLVHGRAMPLGNQDSGAQKTLADAELLIRRRAGTPAAEAGDSVDVLLF